MTPLFSTLISHKEAAGPPPAPAPGVLRGSVLMFTLVILVLLGLMGVSIMLNTRSELTVSHNTYQGRDAFAKADSTARLALFLGRTLLNASAGEPCDIINNAPQPAGRPEFEIRIGNDGLCGGFTLISIQQSGEMPTVEDILDRYLQATGSANVPGSSFTETPHLEILYNGQVVGSAALALYSTSPSDPGGSLGDSGYGSQGEHSIKVYLVVSSNGHRPRAPGEDAGNYYSDLVQGATQSIVTAIYRELIVQ